MSTKAHEQAAAKAVALTAKLSDEALSNAWMATEVGPVTRESAMVRGWMMDELLVRLGEDLFDEWLTDTNTEGSTVDPMVYLAKRA